MGNQFRCARTDSLRLEVVKPDPNVIISIGDLLYIDSATHTAKPAASIAGANKAAKQAAFQAAFAGVAMQRSGLNAGEVSFDLSRYAIPQAITIAVEGEFEFDLAAAHAFNSGDGIAPAADATPNLLNQTVEAAASAGVAIAIAAPPSPLIGNAAATAIVRIKSTIFATSPAGPKGDTGAAG